MNRRALLLSLVLCTVCTLAPPARAADADGDSELHALFDEDWQWSLKEFPEEATLLGDGRFNDRLTDASSDAIERRHAHEREMLDRIRKIERSRLRGQDVISYDLFLYNKQLAVDEQRFPAERMPIDQMSGVQLSFATLASNTSFRTVKDYEDYIARLAAFPRHVDQTIDLMKEGIKTGWVQPAVPLRSLPSEIEGQLVGDPTSSSLYDPFKHFPADISKTDRARLSEAGERAISESFLPAMKTFYGFAKETYLPAARQAIGASALPSGEEYYQLCIRRSTTTRMTAKEIHELGLKEVARIHGEMERVVKESGFNGTFAEFLTFLRTDPRFYYTTADDLMAGYARIAKRADEKLPTLFAQLPRTPYGLRAFPDHEAPAQTTGQYQPGAADGSRAGLFMVNTYKLETRPKYEMEALSLHESVPGHHLQIARAQEQTGLPEFRRNGEYTAYVEGWGLYAESLGEEMGFYQDRYSKFGQLSYEMWRACRLVVDTGMHAFGWSRERAIDFLKENTAKTENDIVVEVDRYIVWPGQALAYKVGELRIKELRARAKRELGERFDVRRFHNAILDDGPLPLDLLDQRINQWIAEQKKQPAPP